MSRSSDSNDEMDAISVSDGDFHDDNDDSEAGQDHDDCNDWPPKEVCTGEYLLHP